MSAKRVIKGVHVVPMGMANAFLIEGDDGLTFFRCCRVRPRRAYSPRCVGAFPQEVGPEIICLTWETPAWG
jgi:hypothetical protein